MLNSFFMICEFFTYNKWAIYLIQDTHVKHQILTFNQFFVFFGKWVLVNFSTVLPMFKKFVQLLQNLSDLSFNSHARTAPLIIAWFFITFSFCFKNIKKTVSSLSNDKFFLLYVWHTLTALHTEKCYMFD